MPIRWDALLARHVARELNELLRGGRVRALRLDGASRDLVLLLGDRALLWRLHPRRGHLRLLPALEPAAGDIAVKARVERVEALPDDRLVRFALAPSRSGHRPMSVVVELLGNQWNAVVTDSGSDAREGATVRHVLWRRDAAHAPRVGHPYRPPSPLGRKGVDGRVTRDEWSRVLGRLPPGERATTLVRTFAWTSPLNADTVLGTDTSLEDGHARWSLMADPMSDTRPVVLATRGGPQPYPFPLAGIQAESAQSLLGAIEACAKPDFEGRVSATGVAPVAPAATAIGADPMRRLEAAARRAARREARLEGELEGLEDSESLRSIGDLILARYHEIPAGASRARLAGFDGEPLEVALDPARPPHGNASAYYARAVKAERARERLPRLIREARAERERLESLAAQAREGEVDEARLREVVGREDPTQRGQVTARSLPYRAYRSSGGLEIRVGRGARNNDDLTFRHSSPGDVWLHARDSAGAHVVLRWPGPGNPPTRDLAEAATLAALHSKARTSGTAPVDWTLRKYVRKLRKAPPGRVAADRVQTLFVEPDPELLERLERLR